MDNDVIVRRGPAGQVPLRGDPTHVTCLEAGDQVLWARDAPPWNARRAGR